MVVGIVVGMGVRNCSGNGVWDGSGDGSDGWK